MQAGDTFYLVDVADRHCWFVLTDPDVLPDEVLIANFTSWQPNADPACDLTPEFCEHDSIRHRTCVEFSRARVVTNAQLDQLVRNNQIRRATPLSPVLLEHIRNCGINSQFIKIDHLQLLVRFVT